VRRGRIELYADKFGAEENNYVNYLKGANIAGFIKVADAMLAYGLM
jgi:glutamate dehydrogenase (NADP+)